MYVKQAMIYKVMLFYISVPRSKIEPKTTLPKIKFFFHVGSVWIFVFGVLILALLFSYKFYAALCNIP